MSTLILQANTASPIIVTCQKAGKAAPRLVGSITTSFNGANRSSIRGQAKVIPILASLVDTATEATIQAACYNGAQIPCSGDILQNIQTLCLIDGVTSNMVPGLPGFFEMSFTVSEVNASTILLKYAPGDTITGETFTRSNIGNYFDANGLLVGAGVNVKRDGHYINGVRTLLLEDTRTNVVLWNRDMTNVAWVKASMTAAKDQTGIDGAANAASSILATGANATVSQGTTAASSARAQVAWVKRLIGSGTIQMTMDNGATWTTITVTASYTKVTIPTQTIANPIVGFRIVTSGDKIAVDYVQNENGAFDSSPIATTTVAVARGADSYSLPFAYPPQEMSVYVKSAELGTFAAAGAQMSITSVGNATPQFRIFSGAGYLAHHFNTSGGAVVVSSLASGPTRGDTVELDAHLFADGSVDITQSLNSGASTSAAQSAALSPLAAAWAAQLVWLNSIGSGNVGFVGLQSFKIVAGARSLPELRAA